MNWKKIAAGVGIGASAFIPGLPAVVAPALLGLGGGEALSGAFDSNGKPKTPDTNAIDPILKSLQEKSAASSAKSDQLSGMSHEALAPVLDYFKKILGNDPSAMLAATAPQRGRVIDQYDTARKSIANFAPRGGGSSEALANSYVTEGQDLSALTSQARSEAVGQSAQLGTQLKALGLSEESLASGDLNSVISAILGQENADAYKSGQNKQLAAGLAEGLGTLLGLFLTRGQKAAA